MVAFVLRPVLGVETCTVLLYRLTAKHCVCVRACMCLRAYVNSEVNVFTFGVDVCQMRLLNPLPLSCLLPRCNKV